MGVQAARLRHGQVSCRLREAWCSAARRKASSSRSTPTSGKSLWNFETGGDIHSNPISYLSGGRQQVAIASGHAILAFALQ